MIDSVVSAAADVLGSTDVEVDPESHFTDLGGDSLSALTFANLLRDILGVDVPVGVIVGPTSDLRQLAEYIEAEREFGSKRPTFASVHGRGRHFVRGRRPHPGQVHRRARRWLPRPSHRLRDRRTEDRSADRRQRLAGTLPCPRTGWSGWRRPAAPLITVMRGATSRPPRARLEAAFDSGDPELAQRFRRWPPTTSRSSRAISASRTRPGRCDVGSAGPQRRSDRSPGGAGQPRAALQRRVRSQRGGYRRDHPAGDHGADQAGHAICRPLRSRCRSRPVTSSRTATSATSARCAPVDSSYANGYANSKWAGEVLLREAHDLCGLPVAVFRSDMILAHTPIRRAAQRAGRLHPVDVERAGDRHRAAARSTSATPTGNPQRAHYDGLPVDFVAESITTLGREADQTTSGRST